MGYAHMKDLGSAWLASSIEQFAKSESATHLVQLTHASSPDVSLSRHVLQTIPCSIFMSAGLHTITAFMQPYCL